MPIALARQLVQHLTAAADLVVDPFAGWNTTARAAELHGARWLSTESAAEYVLTGAQRFKACPGFEEFGALQPWDGFSC
jgi:site-specific DNA-methyltransferase (cytosine-N4-specific)